MSAFSLVKPKSPTQSLGKLLRLQLPRGRRRDAERFLAAAGNSRVSDWGTWDTLFGAVIQRLAK